MFRGLFFVVYEQEETYHSQGVEETYAREMVKAYPTEETMRRIRYVHLPSGDIVKSMQKKQGDKWIQVSEESIVTDPEEIRSVYDGRG